MLNIDYALIGSQPDAEIAVDTLPYNIRCWEQCRDRKLKARIGTLIAKAAAHYYGISLEACGSMTALVDAVRAADQELAVC